METGLRYSQKRVKQVWSLLQRKAILTLGLAILILLTFETWQASTLISDPPREASVRGQEIADRIDPNAADAEDLAAIPNFGEKKAHQIIEFRSAFQQEHPGKAPFLQSSDLLNLKGFGVATVKNFEPYLVFPAAQ